MTQRPDRQFIRTPTAGAGRTPKPDVLQRTAGISSACASPCISHAATDSAMWGDIVDEFPGVLITGQSPTVLVRRGNKLVRVPRTDLPLSSQVWDPDTHLFQQLLPLKEWTQHHAEACTKPLKC